MVEGEGREQRSEVPTVLSAGPLGHHTKKMDTDSPLEGSRSGESVGGRGRGLRGHCGSASRHVEFCQDT
jgi:hypothetical protein